MRGVTEGEKGDERDLMNLQRMLKRTRLNLDRPAKTRSRMIDQITSLIEQLTLEQKVRSKAVVAPVPTKKKVDPKAA